MHAATRTVLGQVVTILLSLVCLAAPSSALSAVITVGPGGAPTYDHASIQAAIDAASNGDTVQVAAGTYNENVFWMDKGLQVLGAGRDVTTVDGGGTAGVFAIVNAPAPSLLSGFTITGGANNNDGAGVVLIDSALTVADNTITDNTASLGMGGGIHVARGAPVILRNIISNNRAGIAGGGLSLDRCTSALVVDNQITGNVADGLGATGGGVYAYMVPDLSISGGSISGNQAPDFGSGGGICAIHCDVEIDGVVMQSNSSNDGGGVYFASGLVGPTLTLRDCIFDANSGGVQGGALYVALGDACTILDCVFRHTTGDYGALVTRIPTLMEGCLFYDNSVSPAYAELCVHGDTVVDRCTLAAPGVGGYAMSVTDGATLTMTNSIVEHGSLDGIIVEPGAALDISHCNVFGTGDQYAWVPDQTGLNGNFSLDPQFANPAAGDFHVRSAFGRYQGGAWVTDPPSEHSPCIDNGKPGDDYVNEADWPVGRVNIGVYGNTAQASKGGNLPPRQPVVDVTPDTPGAGNPLVCTVTTPSTDPNLDPVGYRYQWYEDGVHRPAYDDLATLPAAATEAGNMWKCVVTPHDALVDGPPAEDEVHVRGVIQVPAEYPTIQAGIDAAWDGDTVQVAAGTHKENITWTTKDIQVFASGPATIEGNGLGSVVTISGVPASGRLDGFSITGGGGPAGGGINVTNSSLLIVGCMVSGNGTSGCGGGIYIEGGAPTLEACAISNNEAFEDGGGVYAHSSNLTVSATSFVGDRATRDGGAVFCDGGSIALDASNFSMNRASRDGGAVVVRNGAGALTDNQFDNNSSTRNGGAACISSPVAELSGNTFIRNSFHSVTQVTLGGAVFIDRQSPWAIFPIENNLFVRNSTPFGPAICIRDVHGGAWSIDRCTMAENWGGNVYMVAGSATISNSILWDTQVGPPLSGGATASYCCIGPDPVGDNANGNFTADPRFVDPDVDDYHLKSLFGHWDRSSASWVNDAEHSPCIDNGDPAADLANEPAPDGGCVNLGFHGNTVEASKGGNVPPSQPVVDVTPDAPIGADALVVALTTPSTDPNLDPISYSYRWLRDGVAQADLDDVTTVPADRTAKGETWRCEVTPSDGDADGPMAFDEVTIGNTAPEAAVVDVTPDAPQTGDDLQVTATGGVDPDGDAVSFSYRWLRDGVAQADLDDVTTVPADRTAKGETWRCEVTPSDGDADGPMAFDEVTIGNTAPEAAVVDVTPDAPQTGDDLQVSVTGGTDADGDAVSFSYRWLRDGVAQADLDDVTTVLAARTASGETWRCEVTPSDGQLDGPMAFDEVMIGNTAPGAAVAEIAPAAPQTGDDLLVSATGGADPDGDAVSFSYRWSRDGAAQPDLDDATTVPAARTASGETWRCEVTPSDGQVDGPMAFDEVMIGNTAPGAAVAEIAPAAPQTGDDLLVSATGGADPDGDAVSFSYRWSRDGAAQPDLDDATTVPAARTASGETWRCEVTPNDGDADGPMAFDEVTIGNTAPEAALVDVTPDAPRTADDLQVSATGGADPDGDAVSFSYRWSRDGAAQPDLDDATTVPAARTASGETWRCEVTPSDGDADGPMAFDEVTIGNTAPEAAVVDVTPDAPQTGDDLQVTATGGADADGDAVSYSYRWSRDGAAQPDLDDATTVPAARTASGETWRCEVTPNDGQVDGPMGFDEVTIGNTAPEAALVDVTPDAPQTGDDLQVTATGGADADGDAVSFSYRWLRDGAAQPDLDDATTVPAARTASGETWRCEVTPNDGQVDGPMAFDEVMIGNTAPGAAVAEIAPDAPQTADDLQMTATGGADADGDAVSFSYRWLRDGVARAELDDATTVPSARTTSGETWRCEVTPNDGDADGPMGFDEVTIGNTAPRIASVSIAPDPAVTADDLDATPAGWADADGDAPGYDWQWTRFDGDAWQQIAGATTAALASEQFVAGDRLRVTCVPDDGHSQGAAVSAEITIANTPPGAPSACAITPAEPTGADDLHLAASGAADVDGDALTYEYQWRCSTDGGASWDAWGRDGAMLASALTSVGESWQARARALDGSEAGPWLVSDPVQVCDCEGQSFAAGVQLVGVPLIPADAAPGAVFPGCTVAGDWTGAGYAQPDRVGCGCGYWVDFPGPTELSVRGELIAGDAQTVDLDGAGWHMLGNPFTETLAWGNVSGRGLRGYGWLWDAPTHSYRLLADLVGLNVSSEVPAWTGFWVKLAADATEVTMQRGVAPAADTQPMSLQPVEAEDWVVRLVARAGECTDADNWVGMLQNGGARLSGPPTPAGAWVDLYCPAADGGRDAVSIVGSAAAGLSWDIVVETNVAGVPVTVEYPDLSSVPAEWTLYLVDLDTGARRYMRTTERYQFVADGDGARRHLRVEAVRAGDAPAMLSALTALPTAAGAEICYTLGAAASVDVELLNIAGRTVRVLSRDRVSPAGESRLSWNLISDAGTAVPSGTYLCRVTARSESGRRTDRIVTVQVSRTR